MFESAISVINLSKSYKKVKAVDNLTFTIPKNCIAGFLGPNGAGKTTTLRILLGLSFADSGKVKIFDKEVPTDANEIFEFTGALVEKPAFIDNFSAFENLWWFGNLIKPLVKERITEVLNLVGLQDVAHEDYKSFSAGMKQRLAIAFAILHKPRLLILDEPTTAMDPQGRYHIRELLRKIHLEYSTTIFLSSHLLDEVQKLCNYVVIINNGKLLKEGYVKDILANSLENWEIRIKEQDEDKFKNIILSFDEILNYKKIPRGFEVIMKSNSSAKINEKLVNAGIQVEALIPKEASLEEAYIKLTEK